MVDLNQSVLKAIGLSIIATAEGWKIQWQCESVNINAYSILCEQLAGQTFSQPIPLSVFADLGEQSIDLSYAMLKAATGIDVDIYAHPVIAFVDSHSAIKQCLRIAPRPVPMSVTANFRDYGGQLTADGKQVVWGKLFRTGHMGDMSEADKHALLQLNIRTVCDFRRGEEADNQPSQLPQGLIPTAIAISPGSAINLFSAINDEHIDEETIDVFMQDINRDLVMSHQASYRKMFDALIKQADSGSIIHCSAGKDRTGFAGLLILAALGVESESIMLDYLRTNEYVDITKEVERWAQSHDLVVNNTEVSNTEVHNTDEGNNSKVQKPINRKALAIILKVKPSYLQAALDTIDAQFGGIDNYLRRQMALTDNDFAILKEHYLY